MVSQVPGSALLSRQRLEKFTQVWLFFWGGCEGLVLEIDKNRSMYRSNQHESTISIQPIQADEALQSTCCKMLRGIVGRN